MIYLDFENSVKKIDGQIADLEIHKNSAENSAKVSRLCEKKEAELGKIYRSLGAWEKAQVARHPERPHALDYISGMIDDFIELCGDREFADDQAIVGGIGYLANRPVMVIGEEKGANTESRLKHNFGSPKPEGYRKAVRLMKLADKFGLPIIFLVDTAGAFPGAESEERGQSEAIAAAIQTCLDMTVPTVAVVIGEGGSGGAIAIAVANKVFMLENSIYSVISPEGCASILWKSAEYKKQAAEALHITAEDLEELGIIDNIIEEPVGGAHRHPHETVKRVKAVLLDTLKTMETKGFDAKDDRTAKFLAMTRLGDNK